jgi:hypothetical protein
MATLYEIALEDVTREAELLDRLVAEEKPTDEARFRLERQAEWRAILRTNDFVNGCQIEEDRGGPDFDLYLKEIHEPISGEKAMKEIREWISGEI